MTRDEAMSLSHERSAIGRAHAECTTCEGEGAVVWQCAEDDAPADAWLVNFAHDVARAWREMGGCSPWGVDTCPECGRGREVGKI